MSLFERADSEPPFRFFSENTIGGIMMAKAKYVCSSCGGEIFRYPSQVKGENAYCNKQCLNKYREMRRESRECVFCGKTVIRTKSNFNGKNTFCSQVCKADWQKENLKGENNPFYGKAHNETTKETISLNKLESAPRGKEHPNYSRTAVKCFVCGEKTLKTPYLIKRSHKNYCSDNCRHIGQSDIISGTKNPNFNPDLTSSERERNRVAELGYVKFKNDVLRRCGYKCSICNSEERLVVHHLNSHHWDKENRVNPDNGVALCNGCHKNFHKEYGYKNNTINQFKEYLASV